VITYGPAFMGSIVMDKENISFASVGTTTKNVGNFKKVGRGKSWKRVQSSCTIA
jgi:hypothetical protein